MYQILVVDDDPSGAQLLIELFRFAGYQGYALQDWQDPIADVEQRRPDLVIMDVRLRVFDGFELLRRLRTHPDADIRGIPVLMMSAENVSARCRAAGASGFVEKPFDAECLFRAIREIMEVGVSEN